MGRPRRFCPAEYMFTGQDGQPRGVFECTTRCLQKRYLMQPRPRVTLRFLGVLGRALVTFPSVELYGYHALSNHQSLLIGFVSATQMADFMSYLNGNLARELGLVVGWRSRFWDRRYRSLNVIDEASLIKRLAYSAANSVKEGLVSRADRWPGAHFVKQLLRGPEFGRGEWVDRTALYRARKTDAKVREAEFITRYTVRLSKLPIWNHLDDAEYYEKILELANEARDAAKGQPRVRIMMTDPHFRPQSAARSPAPDVLAASRERREGWRQAYADFLAAYAEATALLRAGRAARFPLDGVPPHHRWVAG